MSQTPIPDDLKEMYHFAQEWRREFGGERRYGAGTVEVLIERIGKAEAQVEALQRENAGLRSEIKTLEFEKKRIIQIGEAQIAKLKAPVSDEELTPHCLGKKYFLTEVFDKVIASRATQSTENER